MTCLNLPQKILARTVTLFILVSIHWSGLSWSNTTSMVTNHKHPLMQHLPKEKNNSTIRLEVLKIVPQTGYVTIRLWDTNSNKPIQMSDLRKIHTQKIHVLIIDQSLSDYHHVHPQTTQIPGEYQFIWHLNKKNASYHIWADIVPKNGQQEYILSDLIRGGKGLTPINRSLNFKQKIGGYQFKLSFEDRKLFVGKPSMGKIDILSAHGKPVQNLEPVMGAYAHIVGFSDDFKTIVHAHPMGKEPTKESDRGGSTLRFHLEPQTAGFIKLFIQVKINGKMLFVPFGLYISATEKV